MMTRTAFPSLLATLLVAASTTATATTASGRELQGINLCAAYDIVVPLMEDGYDHCVCEGRTIVCDFDGVCNDGNADECADLDMKIDFTEEGGEYITYTTTYADGTFAPVEIVLDVESDVSAINSCRTTYGEEGVAEACTCSVCADGFGIDVDCGAIQEGVTTGGCAPIDVKNFEAYVPFFGESSNKVITGLETEDQQSKSGARTTAAAAAALASLVVAAVAL